MKNLLEFIIKSLVDKPDEVKVDLSEKDGEIILTFSVNKEDMGKVIGKDGKIIKARRTIIRARSIKEGKRVEINLEEKT